MTSFYFPSNPLSRQVDRMTTLAENAMAAQNPAHVQQAKAVLGILKQGRHAEEVAGVASVAKEQYSVDAVRSDGDVREIRVFRPVGGGRFEKRVIREERVADGVYITKDITGG